MKYDDELISKAAWYYYIENMTQQSIAEKLGISRMKVIRLLEAARETGIIQFRISQGNGKQLPIEQKLRQQWNLKNVLIIPTPDNRARLNEHLALAAANFLADQVTENTFINMGYGDTPSRVLNHLANITDVPVSIVSFTGGVSYYLPNSTSNVFKARLHLYPAPLVLSSREVCQSILQEPSVKEIRRMVKLSSFSIVGIGAMNPDATILSNGILSQNDFAYLTMKGAVGDILTHFIDKNGVPVVTSIEDRLVSTPLDTLKELNNVIGIAGGEQKVAVIRAALQGGYIDSLITDEDTAKKLIGE
jgi:lsr operon transcriptional repressor